MEKSGSLSILYAWPPVVSPTYPPLKSPPMNYPGRLPGQSQKLQSINFSILYQFREIELFAPFARESVYFVVHLNKFFLSIPQSL